MPALSVVLSPENLGIDAPLAPARGSRMTGFGDADFMPHLARPADAFVLRRFGIPVESRMEVTPAL